MRSAYLATATIYFGGNITNCHSGDNFFPSYGCAPVNTTITGTFVDPIPTPSVPGGWTVKGVQLQVATSICGRPGFTGAPVSGFNPKYSDPFR
jgi:hypothetical protein